MAGETALARQLKKLSAPQTSLLIQDKIRKSFLFDHRDAAALDRDIIFAYGTTGLEKLKIINSMFGKFEHNLFSVSYKDFERSVQTFSVNKKLDEKINEFLRTLSPYVLTRAAHEALEWLIYRFHIHLYNADDLVASVLPHFNTSTFVRVVQLLNLDDPNCRWAWLMPVQKSGVHLEYSMILNHFNADRGFRKFICDLAPRSLSVFISHEAFASPIISFSMLTIYSALGRSGPITEDMITFLFPYFLKGLKSSFNKYIAASYLVISKIISNVKLTDVLVTEVLVKVFENVSVDLLKEAFELLLLIFQQQPIKKLAKKLFNLLFLQKECLKHLINMSENYKATSLLAAIFKVSIPMVLSLKARNPKSKKCRNLLEFIVQLINSARFSEKLAILCFNAILNSYSGFQDDFKCGKYQDKFKFHNQSLKQTAKVLLKSLESRYPEHFDVALSNFFKKKQIKNKRRMCKLINDSVCSVKNKVLLDRRTTLVLGINHANSAIRKNSVKFLLEQTVSKQISDINFLESSLHERLCDDSSDVVIEVLSSPEILLQYVDKKKILSGFGHIFQKRIDEDSKWYPVQMLCMDILCRSFADEQELAFEIFATLIRFIFPLTKKSAPGFLLILKSKLRCILPVIQMFEITHTVSFNGDNDKKQLVLLNMAVISSLKKYVEKLSDSEKSSFLSLLKEKSLNSNNNSLFVMFILASGDAIVSGSQLNEKYEWIDNLLSVFETFHRPNVVLEKFNVDITEESVVEKCVNVLWKNQFPGVIIYHTFHKIVKFTKLNCHTSTSNFWLSKCDDRDFKAFKILTLLFDLCVRQINCSKSTFAENFKNLCSIFIDSQFQTTENLFGFLSLLWSNVMETVPVYLQVAALETAKVSCDRFNNLDWLFENFTFTISLLKAIASPHVEVRSTSLSVLSSLLQCSENTACASKSLLETVCDNQEEIRTDHRQCYYVLNNWLSPAFELFRSPDSSQTQNADAALENRCLILDDFIKILSEETTPNSMKNHVLLCLQDADSVGLLSAYIPVINKLLLQVKGNEKPMDQSSLDILELLLQKFTPKIAACLKDNSRETDTLFKCLEFVEKGNTTHISIILFTLKILSRDFFTAISSVLVQKKILDILLNAYLTSAPDVNIEIKKVLSKLCTYAYLILKDLQGEDIFGQTITGRKKSQNKKENLPEWKKITVLLEIIQNKSKLDKREVLITQLFDMLGKTQYNTLPSVEYIRQLILSTIYNCCQHLGTDYLDKKDFKNEEIVKCIRFSKNPKTHHQALLLLNLAATLFPDCVLVNTMAIFTFMDQNLVRQEDSYSFQVITQTIETIVPSLLEASSRQNESTAVQNVAAVTRVFVNSLSHIPQHRQLPLFSKLITTLDPSQYFWIPIGQICERYSTVFHDMTSDDINRWKVSPIVEFAVNLNEQFTPTVQINACINLLNFLSLLPDSKESSSSGPAVQNFTEPFDVSNHTDQELQIYKYNVLSYINILLSSQAFISQISELDLKAMNSLEEKYETLLEKVLHYLQHQRSLNLENNGNRHDLFPLLFDLVGHVNALLPCNQFIRVVRRLLRNSEPIIQKKAIELLNCKLEQQQHLFKEENHVSLLKLLNPLLKVVRKYSDDDVSEGENTTVNQQTALYALHLLTKVIGSEFPSKFHKVLNVAIRILTDNVNEELTVNALLCLAQLCNSLNVEVLPQLNTFMPIIVNLLTDHKILELNDCLILGIITALISLVKNLGVFLSSYMQSLVTSVCLLATKYLEVNKKSVHEKLLTFQTLLANDVALRILLTAIEDSYLKVCTKDPRAVIPLMHMLEEKLTCCSYTDIEACSIQLQQFCILLLDFRNSYSTTSSESSVTSIELSIFSTLKTFVMKLSVTHFQGFFKKIYQWSTATEVKQKLRIFTFYGLTCELSKTLKNLFVVVAKFFLKHAASELDSNNSIKHDDVDFLGDPPMLTQHLNNILDTLHTCFLNDDGHLLDKDTFESLMQPIVDQLENLFSDEKAYQERISQHLSGCIAHFMAAVSDNAMWKKLNYQILLKTRHESPVVRFAAIQVIREVVTVMGDNYLVLLPESIPFLAEVMEDESSEVEHECQSVITEMEKILGEPIRKYF